MDKKNCKTGKRTKRQVEKILMVIDVKREIIDILQITNRRFMYNPQTGTLILGDEMYGKSICSSHSQEFYASKAEGLEKPNKFDPFGQKESAHLIYHTIAPLKVLVMGVNFILPF